MRARPQAREVAPMPHAVGGLPHACAAAPTPLPGAPPARPGSIGVVPCRNVSGHPRRVSASLALSHGARYAPNVLLRHRVWRRTDRSPWHNWTARRPPEPKVSGSNPDGDVPSFRTCGSLGLRSCTKKSGVMVCSTVTPLSVVNQDTDPVNRRRLKPPTGRQSGTHHPSTSRC